MQHILRSWQGVKNSRHKSGFYHGNMWVKQDLLEFYELVGKQSKAMFFERFTIGGSTYYPNDLVSGPCRASRAINVTMITADKTPQLSQGVDSREFGKKQTNKQYLDIPRCSMYGIFTIWVIFYGKCWDSYSIHGASGIMTQ